LAHEQGRRLGQGLVLTPDLLLQLLDALLIRSPLGALGLTTDRGIGLDAGSPPDRDQLGVDPLTPAIGTEFRGVEVGGLDDDGELPGTVALNAPSSAKSPAIIHAPNCELSYCHTIDPGHAEFLCRVKFGRK
jgi:hypothetical protein